MSQKLFIAVMLAALSLQSQATSGPQGAPVSFLDQLAIPHDYKVTFEDAAGKSIAFDRFQAAIATHPFDVRKDTLKHQATLRLQSDAMAGPSQKNAAKSKTLPITGQAFPAFCATTLEGAPISLRALRGKPFVANFFFAQCAPCIAETPVLSAFHRAHPDIPVVAFTFDDAGVASEFVRQRQFSWPVVAEQETLASKAGVKVYPVLMLVDAKGIVTSALPSDALKSDGKALTVDDLVRWTGGAR